ncbi:hypothetical protein AYO47_03790 [Planctomyces sp. SCGC AG-212-M04]|nr:hypothetical protein AYO47_03790 [Planctomyces sp. SCGC AG-212-M04]
MIRFCLPLPAACSCLLLVAALSGCGSAGAAPVVSLSPVEGEVTIDGNPVQGVSVRFMPRGTTRGQGSYGVTDAAGKYVCMHTSGKPGCEQGDYVVLFSRMTTRDGKPIPENANAADLEARESLPARFQNPDSKQNVVNVKGEPNHFDFALKTK